MRSSAFTSPYASFTRSSLKTLAPHSALPTVPLPLRRYVSTTRRQCRQSIAECAGPKKHACPATISSVSFSTSLDVLAHPAPSRCTVNSESNARPKKSNVGACDRAVVARATPRSASRVATAAVSHSGRAYASGPIRDASESAAPTGARTLAQYASACASSRVPSAARPAASQTKRCTSGGNENEGTPALSPPVCEFTNPASAPACASNSAPQLGRFTHARHSAFLRVRAASKVLAATFCAPVSPGHAVRAVRATRSSASTAFTPPPRSEKGGGVLFITFRSPPPR